MICMWTITFSKSTSRCTFLNLLDKSWQTPPKKGIPILFNLPSYPKTMLPCRVSGRSRSFAALLLRLRAKQADTALAFDTLPERCGSTVSSTLTGWTIFVSNVSKTVGGKKLQISKVKITSTRCEDTQRCLGVLWRSGFVWVKGYICNIKCIFPIITFFKNLCVFDYICLELLRYV